MLKTTPRKKFLVTKPHKVCEAARVLQELWSHGGGGEEGGIGGVLS
jgi:hypothetical protein